MTVARTLNAVKPLMMFHIKGKAGAHAVSCHKVLLVWEQCQQEEVKRNTLFCSVYLKETRFPDSKDKSVFSHIVHMCEKWGSMNISNSAFNVFALYSKCKEI